jgi:hypothetical protein
MKHLLLFAASLLTVPVLHAQTVPNGGFENWNTLTYENPQYYISSNSDVFRMNLPSNVTKVTDPQQGTFALRMETVSNGTDTMFGYFVNGDPASTEGGIPYTQHPITLTGYYKCNVMPGDTALVVVVFKQGGVVLSEDIAIFTGSQSAYTQFTVPLTIPPLSNPDTVIIGGASSNAFSVQGIPGSMLQLDNLSFTGVTSQPSMMNGSFENWDPVNLHFPAQWGVGGDTIYRTTDAHSGTFALQLNTIQYDPFNAGPSFATNGTATLNSGPDGGRPYTLLNDTLHGWYKYTPNGIDSATLFIAATNNGTMVGGGVLALPPAASYTSFTLPFSSFTQPDTLIVVFVSSYNNTTLNNAGSILKVDDVYLSSSPVGTPEIQWNAFGRVALYPNPASGACWLEWSNNGNSPVTIMITDELGRIVSEESVSEYGAQRKQVDVSGMESGVYFVTLSQDGKRISRKLIVK